jgi:hypothetical protein
VSSTVIVAIVTSVSTLTGALIAGFISFKVQTQQLAVQAALAVSEREEKRSQGRIERRKGAYATFLNSFSDIEEILYRCWHEDEALGEENAEISKLQKKLTKATMGLSRQISLLAIEGPFEAWRAAFDLLQVLFMEMTVISEVACRPEAVGRVLGAVDSERCTTAWSTRELAKIKFVGSLPQD